ncbi:hypothetical protein COU19_01665 [Candidatus Kaiserbacteria bacterium CG10_big_fil_rev_8_21_14_0_10_56_12]|uniref:Protein TolB n=1 Tax=Candidatus Kaiserbacteria bacterium CG10_big_fil_rev_8_21_14_0_10_56_12 TaxID=1974611 RepID=A0A2H0U9Y2_9BACT|nr:MAG: hypothetical protein COU19_01665 [Candidatus Kaiserbacteria bacterium CG10_big_fil_rev_8_21_14_0_10_56_12]
MRRALFIAAVTIVLVGIGVFVYFSFFANRAAVVVAPSPSPTLPIAGDVGGAAGSNASTTPVSPESGVNAPPRLAQITKGPVVPGEVLVNIDAAASSTRDVLVSYIERQSGNVFHYSVAAGNITRTSNRTLPGIQSAEWLPNGSAVFVRYLSGDDSATINTYALPANGTSGFFLPQNLADIAVSSTSVLTLAASSNGSVGAVNPTNAARSTTVFTTALSSLRVGFVGTTHYLVFTKPTASLAGDVFLVDKKGVFARLFGPAHGLVALPSHSGKWVLVSYVDNASMQMRLVDTATGETLSLPLSTIADKCAWTLDDRAVYCGVPTDPPITYTYPDDWYQGAVHFSDRLWEIDVAGRFAKLVLDFSATTKASLDAQALALDPAQTTLVFMNRNDGALWAYRL